jgi:hypothetical protein
LPNFLSSASARQVGQGEYKSVPTPAVQRLIKTEVHPQISTSPPSFSPPFFRTGLLRGVPRLAFFTQLPVRSWRFRYDERRFRLSVDLGPPPLLRFVHPLSGGSTALFMHTSSKFWWCSERNLQPLPVQGRTSARDQKLEIALVIRTDRDRAVGVIQNVDLVVTDRIEMPGLK